MHRDGGGLLHAVPHRATRAGAGLQELSERQCSEPLPDWSGGADDERVQSRDGPSAAFDRLPAGGQQHLDGFSLFAAAWSAEADTGERLPGRPDRVSIVTLHANSTGGSLRAVDLNDPLAASQQCRGQSGTEAAGAFDGPQCRVVAPPEDDQLAVASRLAGTVRCSRTAPVPPTAAAVWVSLWVSTPMTTSRSGWTASMQFAP